MKNRNDEDRVLLGLVAVAIVGSVSIGLAFALAPAPPGAPASQQVAVEGEGDATPAGGEADAAPVSYADGVEPVAEYAPRFNIPQAIAAPTPEGEWNEEGWLFVATEVGRGVSVFDLKTLQPIRFLYSPDSPVPHHPYISPDQRWVIANARFGSEVMVIDTHNDFEQTFLEFPKGEDGDVAGPLHSTYTSEQLEISGRVAAQQPSRRH